MRLGIIFSSLVWLGLWSALAVPICASAQSVQVTPTSVGPGGRVSVQWTAPGRAGQDNWIGLYRVGTPADSANLARPVWQWAKGESGTLQFDMPNWSGQFVFRLFYGGAYDLRATSNAFTIQANIKAPVQKQPTPRPPILYTYQWHEPSARLPHTQTLLANNQCAYGYRYWNDWGKTICARCDANYSLMAWYNGPTSSGDTRCVRCNAGFGYAARDANGRSLCVKCPAGYIFTVSQGKNICLRRGAGP